MPTNQFEEVINALKARGIRLTDTRKAIISYLIHNDNHPSAEMIYQNLLPTYPSLSLATVYNNLRFLLEAGFITVLKRKNDSTTYYDFICNNHLNLICEECGDILDAMIEHDSLAPLVEQQTGFRVRKETLTLYGVCATCLKK